MVQIIKKWLHRYFADPEAVTLCVVIAAIIAIFAVLHNILLPIILSVIIAYVLGGLVARLEHWKFPHLFAVILVYLLFITGLAILLIWLLPLLFQQLTNLFSEAPNMINRGQSFLADIQARHPDILSADQLKRFLAEFNVYLTRFGRFAISYSISSIGNIITLIVYLILVPLLVFFFIKDGRKIATWLSNFLPKKHNVLLNILREVDSKIGDYIRGKMLEIIIVGIVSIVAFALMGLNYAILLGVCVGLSVVIPYIGAIVVTIPVVIIAFLQWGLVPHFAYLLLIYTIIITLDANLLVPILFSEKMKLHPIVIMLSVLVFGDLWGFWGIFFAIPLATLVDALIKSWPRTIEEE